MSLKTKENWGSVEQQECYQLKHRARNPISPFRRTEQLNLFDLRKERLEIRNDISTNKTAEGNLALINSHNCGVRKGVPRNNSSREMICPRSLHRRTQLERSENTISAYKRKVTFADPVAMSILDPEVTVEYIGHVRGQGGVGFSTFSNQTTSNSSDVDKSDFTTLRGDEGSCSQLCCRVIHEPDEDRISDIPKTRLLFFLAIRRRCLMVFAIVSVAFIVTIAGIGTIAYLAKDNNDSAVNPSLSPQKTKMPSLVDDVLSISSFTVSDCGSW